VETAGGKINMKKGTLALISLFFLTCSLPLQACQFVSGDNYGDKNASIIVEKLTPAVFEWSGLKINMDETEPGEEVVITTCLSNTGGSEGTYIIDLEINGIAEQSDKVILPAGAKYYCVFKLTKSEPGTYEVVIGDLTGKFTVLKPVEIIQVTTPDETTYKRQSQRSSCCPEGSGNSCE
jgi:hypothetical protein